MSNDAENMNPQLRFWLAYGNETFPSLSYYQGVYALDTVRDMQVPQRMHYTDIWSPNPERPTVADWKFDGHDADGGKWIAALTGE